LINSKEHVEKRKEKAKSPEKSAKEIVNCCCIRYVSSFFGPLQLIFIA